MSSNSGKWETVVNNKKKNVTKSDVKKAQQKFLEGEKVPKVEQRDPIKLDTTVYAAGFDNKRFSDSIIEEPEKYPSRLNYEKEEARQVSPRNVNRKKEKKPQKQQTAPFDMAAKIKKLDKKALESHLKENESKFPDQHLIRLKYASNWLHKELEGPNEKTDLAYLNKPHDYPLCEVANGIRGLLAAEIKKCDKKTLSAYFTFLVAALTAEVQQLHCTVAYRLLIQLICKINPDIFVETCDEIVHGKSKNADSYLAIIWVFSHCTHNLKHGLSVWWSCMFSVLDKKNHAQASVRFFNNLMCNGSMMKTDSALLTSNELIDLLEVMVSEKSPLQHSPSLMEEMYGHKEKLTNLAVNADNGKTVFVNMLPVLRQKEDANTKYAICDVLLQCMCLNPLALQWWHENVIHHMRESSVLLKHISSKLEEVNEQMVASKKHKKSVLLDTAQEIRTQLDKANEKGRFEKKAGFKDCRRSCSNIIQTLPKVKSNERSSLFKLFKWIIIILLLIGAVDIYRSPSYRESSVGYYLKGSGVEEKFVVVLDISKVYTDKFSSFVGQHAPYYYSKVSVYIDPILEKSSVLLKDSFEYLYKVTTPLRVYLNEVLPPIFESVSNFIVTQYQVIATTVSTTYEKYFPVIYEAISHDLCCETIPKILNYFKDAAESIFHKIYSLHPESFDVLYEYCSTFWEYLLKMTPIWYDVARNTTISFAFSTQKYILEGQQWIQQQMGNFSPTTASK